MNEFSDTSNSSTLLKDNYQATNDLKEALIRRKAKLVTQGSVSPNPIYNSKPIEPENG